MLIIKSLLLAIYFHTQVAVLAAPVPPEAHASNDLLKKSSAKRKKPGREVCLDCVTLKFTVAPEDHGVDAQGKEDKRRRFSGEPLIYQRVLGQ